MCVCVGNEDVGLSCVSARVCVCEVRKLTCLELVCVGVNSVAIRRQCYMVFGQR